MNKLKEEVFKKNIAMASLSMLLGVVFIALSYPYISFLIVGHQQYVGLAIGILILLYGCYQLLKARETITNRSYIEDSILLYPIFLAYKMIRRLT